MAIQPNCAPLMTGTNNGFKY